MLFITDTLYILQADIKLTYIASPGPGGQNVNKVATGVQLRFNIVNCRTLPVFIRRRIMEKMQSRLTARGDLLIKATRFRTQERNKQDAFERLLDLLQAAVKEPKIRKKTKLTRAVKQRRLTQKKQHGQKKQNRVKTFLKNDD